MSNYPPHYAYPSAPPLVRAKPNPPRLHWGWVLALCIVTFGLFIPVWLFVQALWVKKMTGRNTAFGWTLAYLLFLPGMIVDGILLGVVAMIIHTPVKSMTSGLEFLVRISVFVLSLFAIFTLKGELEVEPIGIPLSGAMAFFFSAIYFQYHLWDYSVAEEGGSFSGSQETQGLGLAGGPVAAIVSAPNGPETI